MFKKHIDLSNDVDYIRQMLKHNDRCTGLDYMGRHCNILPIEARTILTLRKFSTYYQLPINGKIRAELIFIVSTIV